jgi:signal peptidase I
MKNILRRITLGISIVLLAMCGGAVLLMNRPVAGYRALTVPTGSMRPGISPGSVVLTHQVATSSLHVGDVVTYTSPLTMRSTLTHRIIKIYKLDGKTPSIITKGDANPTADPPAVMGLIKGKMVGHLPYIGTLFMWAKTWPGLIALIYLPAFIIIGRETKRLAAYWRIMKPYHLFGFPIRRREPEHDYRPRLALAGGAAAVLLAACGGIGWQSASALFATNTVALSPNTLGLVPVTPPSSGGGGTTTTNTTATCTNTTNVNVQNNSNQTATSGNASVAGNANGGPATSGNATNSTTNTTTITTTNGC